MVRRVELEGWTAGAVAEAFAVGERTVRQGLARWRVEGAAGLQDRKPVGPASSPTSWPCSGWR